MSEPLFSFRTELERTRVCDGKPAFAQIPVECTVRLDLDGIPEVRAVCTEDAPFFFDDAGWHLTGEIAAPAGALLYGGGVDRLEPGEEDLLQTHAETHLRAYQEQRADGLREEWFGQYAPLFDHGFDQRPQDERMAA